MSNADNSMDKVKKVLGDVKDTYETTRYGYNRFQKSKENLRKISGQYMEKALEYEDKIDAYIQKTVLFCIVMIAATVCICIFL